MYIRTISMTESHKIKCSSCDSEAVYRYGRAWTGKQRFKCLICKRQFTSGNMRPELKDRPNCSVCGDQMHIYKREVGLIRFRCSNYPECKTFKKVIIDET